ncbi:MAG: phage head closure protein [Janthinobacterium lividum]
MALAAKLKRRVTLQQRAPGQNSFGEPNGWVDVIETGDGKIWAGITNMSGRQYLAAQAGQNEVQTEILIRYQAGVSPTMRVLHGTDIYDIAAVLDVNHRWQRLMCTKGVNNG